MMVGPDTQRWNAKVRTLFEYWRSIHPAPDRLPGRAAFDPLAVHELLPRIMLLDVVGTPPRFRYRLIGTRMVDALGADFTGRWLDEAHWRPDGTPPVFPSYERVATEGVHDWRRGAPHFAGYIDRCAELERVFLPLAADGSAVDMILAINVFFDAEGEEI